MGPVRGRNVAEALVENVIRRKILAARAEVADGGPGADRGWRLALARAARDELKLPLDIASLVMEKRSLAEFLKLPPDPGRILRLRAEGRGVMPHHRTIVEDSSLPGFSEALALQVAAADCVLQAVVARMSLPLSRLMDLQIGEVMVLPRAGIDRITFEGLDGRAVAEGKLGQNRGMRAIRLTLAAAVSRPSPQETVAAVPAPMPEPLRQSA